MGFALSFVQEDRVLREFFTARLLDTLHAQAMEQHQHVELHQQMVVHAIGSMVENVHFLRHLERQAEAWARPWQPVGLPLYL